MTLALALVTSIFVAPERYCRSLHSTDVYAPTGPFEIRCQDGKDYTLSVTKGESETPDQQQANREAWLSLLASGVPDRASEGRCANADAQSQPHCATHSRDLWTARSPHPCFTLRSRCTLACQAHALALPAFETAFGRTCSRWR